MAKKINGLKADKYNEPVELENELNYEVEEEINYDLDAEDVKPKKKSKKKKNKKSKEIDLNLEDEFNTHTKNKTNMLIKIFNILFVLALVAMAIISIDVISVTKFNKGPFFAIKTETYKDGGSKVYYGLGYKVIKYNQIMGRQDTQIGFWTMPFNTTPTQIQDIDLAIEFQNKPEKTGKKYYNQYLAVSSTIKSINKQANELTLEYTDPDGKYTLQIVCPMASKPSDIIDFTEQQEVTVKGTVKSFTLKDSKQPNTVYLKNCFAE